MKKKNMIELIDSFKNDTILEDELKDALKNRLSNYNEKNVRYYLSDLYKANLIYRYNTNVFKKNNGKNDFNIDSNIPDAVLKLLEGIEPSILVSLWSLSTITKYISLQMFSNIHFIEVYSYAKECVLETLIENNIKAIYEEDYYSVSKYIKTDELYIIRTINEDSPINKPVGFASVSSTILTTPKVEKILVDVITTDFFDMLFGSEIREISERLLKEYKINMKSCKRYAAKKYKMDVFTRYLTYINFDIESGEFE